MNQLTIEDLPFQLNLDLTELRNQFLKEQQNLSSNILEVEGPDIEPTSHPVGTSVPVGQTNPEFEAGFKATMEKLGIDTSSYTKWY